MYHLLLQEKLVLQDITEQPVLLESLVYQERMDTMGLQEKMDIMV